MRDNVDMLVMCMEVNIMKKDVWSLGISLIVLV